MGYPGGKSGAGVYQTIINQIPPHETYIEAFAGGAAIFRKMRPAPSSLLIEKHGPQAAALDFEFKDQATIIHGDALDVLGSYKFTGREFVYFDPPYVMETRRVQNRDLYACELSLADHNQLLGLICRLPCMVMISGYRSDLYDRALADFRTIEYEAATRGGMATETLWMNYAPPVALHDYQYIGDNYRERENIRKKANRWATNLKEMPALERQAILSAIAADPAISGGAGLSHQEDRR